MITNDNKSKESEARDATSRGSPELNPKLTSSDKADSEQVIITVNCHCSSGKTFREMASQTEEERPVSRAEFEFQADINDRKRRENEQNIKGIIKWKTLVNDRLRKIEKMHEREILEMRAQFCTLSAEVASNTQKYHRQGKSQSNDQNSKNKPTQHNSKVDIVDLWNDGEEAMDESIWDISHTQSTPANKSESARVNKQYKASATQGNTNKGGQYQAKQGHQGQQNPQNRPRQTAPNTRSSA